MIDSRNLTGLSDLITEDHTFIDIPGRVHEGGDTMIVGWAEFFREYPNYRNNFTSIKAKGDSVIMIDFSECSYDPLNCPAIWTAEITDGLVSEWRVYDDTEEVRRKLDVK
jgi:hypothetical protein